LKIKNRNKYKKKHWNKKIIGCLGVGRAVGTTNLVLSVANCLANGCGLRVAVIEANTHNDYLSLRRRTEYGNASQNSFEAGGIYIYRKLSSCETAEVLAMDYDAVILDLQYEDADWNIWLAQCDRKIAIVGLQPWNRRSAERFLQQEHTKLQQITCVSLSVFPQFQKWIRKQYEIDVTEIPMERDVFCIQSENLHWYQNLIQ